VQAKELRERLREMTERLTEIVQEAECPICMVNVADSALACGHCFCFMEPCGSLQIEACPTCGGNVDSKTKLYGVVASLGGLASMISGEQQPPGEGGSGAVEEAEEGGAVIKARPEVLPEKEEGGEAKKLSMDLLPHAVEHRRPEPLNPKF